MVSLLKMKALAVKQVYTQKNKSPLKKKNTHTHLEKGICGVLDAFSFVLPATRVIFQTPPADLLC